MKCGDGNRVLNNRVHGALWNAIEVGYCARTVIAGNDIANAKIGVFATFMESVEIYDNAIRNVDRYGIAVKNTAGALIARNEVSASPEGIFVHWDGSNRDLLWFLRRPLDTWQSRANVVSANRLRDLSGVGIHLRDSTENRLTGNRFESVEREYWMEGDVRENVIE